MRVRIHSRGLTFVELMLVIVLVSVILVVSAPRLRSTFVGLEVLNFAQKISGLMRYAQSRAIAEREKIYLAYAPEQSGKGRNLFLTKKPPEENKREILEERYRLFIPERIEIEPKPKPPEFIFNPDGSIAVSNPSDGNQEPKIIVSNDVRRFQITAKGAIGRVEVEEKFE